MSSSRNNKKQPQAKQEQQTSGSGLSPQDTKLLSFVRSNAPQICAGITLAAAHEAQQHNYGEMQTLNNVATQLGSLTGQTWNQQGQAERQQQAPRAMGAAAGSSG